MLKKKLKMNELRFFFDIKKGKLYNFKKII
jgi:hypothetical protein